MNIQAIVKTFMSTILNSASDTAFNFPCIYIDIALNKHNLYYAQVNILPHWRQISTEEWRAVDKACMSELNRFIQLSETEGFRLV